MKKTSQDRKSFPGYRSIQVPTKVWEPLLDIELRVRRSSNCNTPPAWRGTADGGSFHTGFVAHIQNKVGNQHLVFPSLSLISPHPRVDFRMSCCYSFPV